MNWKLTVMSSFTDLADAKKISMNSRSFGREKRVYIHFERLCQDQQFRICDTTELRFDF